MKLVTFTHKNVTRIGKLVDAGVLDIAVACPSLPHDMQAFLALGQEAMRAVQNIESNASTVIPLADVKLEAPVPNPKKYLAIGMNYKDHVEEAARKGMKLPEVQIWFNKQISCVTGPYDPIEMPNMSTMLDYEVELCAVIGKRCKNVSVENAHEVIAGYMIANDVTVRDVQWRSPTWTLGKSFDTHGPIGPYLVTADEIKDPHNLNLKLTVNGEERQNSNTSAMVYNIYQQIAHLTEIMTLEPGDLLATGTPMGVGAAMDPAIYLKVGDVVRAEIEQLGFIENTVVKQ